MHLALDPVLGSSGVIRSVLVLYVDNRSANGVPLLLGSHFLRDRELVFKPFRTIA